MRQNTALRFKRACEHGSIRIATRIETGLSADQGESNDASSETVSCGWRISCYIILTVAWVVSKVFMSLSRRTPEFWAVVSRSSFGCLEYDEVLNSARLKPHVVHGNSSFGSDDPNSAHDFWILVS